MEGSIYIEGGEEGLVFGAEPLDAKGTGGGREEANGDQAVGGGGREGGGGGGGGGGVRHAEEDAMLEGKGGDKGEG